MIRILHTGDWHGDKSLLGVSRYDEVERAVEQTVRTAIDQKVDLYVHTGDICDPDDGPKLIQSQCLVMHAARELADAGVSSCWLAGNHDVCEDGSGLTSISVLRHLHPLVFTYETPFVTLFGDLRLTFVALPYVARSSAEAYSPGWKLQGLEGLDGRVLVATHLMVPGAQIGDETTEMARGRDIEFPWDRIRPEWTAIAGHYHRRQVIRSSTGKKVHVCGSLARLSFGEERNEPSFQILEIA